MDFRDMTCRASSNIAIIKYWGKKDELLNLPLNDSFSLTFGVELSTLTNIRCLREDENLTNAGIVDNGFDDLVVMNGIQVRLNDRLTKVFNAFRSFKAVKQRLGAHRLLIQTKNTFPTAAGLASSASGYACLVYALVRFCGFTPDELMVIDVGERLNLTRLARYGSGSAARSLFGGFVHWRRGWIDDDFPYSDVEYPVELSSRSIALPTHSADHWLDLCCLVCIVDSTMKKVGSTAAMVRSEKTSQMLKDRILKVDDKITAIKKAVDEKNFESFAKITMEDSDNLHAICLDSKPPVNYLDNTSHAVIRFVRLFNTRFGVKLAYTFDAGPNPVLFVERGNIGNVAIILSELFGKDSSSANRLKFSGRIDILDSKPDSVAGELTSFMNECDVEGTLSEVIITTVGIGPEVLPDKPSEFF